MTDPRFDNAKGATASRERWEFCDIEVTVTSPATGKTASMELLYEMLLIDPETVAADVTTLMRRVDDVDDAPLDDGSHDDGP